VSANCNIYMGSSDTDVWRVLTTNGIPGRDYKTLADVQANTPHEQRSNQLPSTFWTTGLAFIRYTKPWEPFNLRDPLSLCGWRVGPTYFYPPAEAMQ
jgi:hypothetical protein